MMLIASFGLSCCCTIRCCSCLRAHVRLRVRRYFVRPNWRTGVPGCVGVQVLHRRSSCTICTVCAHAGAGQAFVPQPLAGAAAGATRCCRSSGGEPAGLGRHLLFQSLPGVVEVRAARHRQSMMPCGPATMHQSTGHSRRLPLQHSSC